MATFQEIKVVGAGLIGTSIALGLKGAGYNVSIDDEYPEVEALAQNLIGQISFGTEPDLVIIATPISAVSTLVQVYGTRYPHASLMDVAGLKSEVMREIDKFPEISPRFCASHPMAGREIAGALAARADLFQGRIWIYTPSGHTNDLALSRALEVVGALGGLPVLLEAEEHDEAIAGISHLPQIVSSLLSVSLEEVSDRNLALAGQGLKDVSRLAASDPTLWAELLHANRGKLVEFLKVLSKNLEEISTSLQNDDLRKTHEILSRAKENHQRIPGKHGGKKRDYWYLPIVIDDKAGQLAMIFDHCAGVAVNVEDLTIEHSPGQETGLITLALSRSDAEKLHKKLSDSGWKVHLPRESIG
jgi:prephenate dehydrogenase